MISFWNAYDHSLLVFLSVMLHEETFFIKKEFLTSRSHILSYIPIMVITNVKNENVLLSHEDFFKW